jgi:hypothetical protein
MYKDKQQYGIKISEKTYERITIFAVWLAILLFVVLIFVMRPQFPESHFVYDGNGNWTLFNNTLI